MPDGFVRWPLVLQLAPARRDRHSREKGSMQFLRQHNETKTTTKARGDAAEAKALAYLQAQGLRLLMRNYRTPGRGGGEIDLIMQHPDGTVVFVEVRQRSGQRYGARQPPWPGPSSSALCVRLSITCCVGTVCRPFVLMWWHSMASSCSGSKALLMRPDSADLCALSPPGHAAGGMISPHVRPAYSATHH